ncbi:chemotaxis response regulator protein-glutamate methylesterase [Kordiimonas sp. SCSIO 12610]|uniref:protein-glutamate methylesterase/protein-glutamine glutaminase n=1 Tax=Kordiimonas sp. SCSIO 12610 TaxID=2829597 RepID=UPI0021FEA4EE|nr:chemotaxis response regulator protein-glutamate methylesterase [Kordiimonas sp. SCSIO 12610]
MVVDDSAIIRGFLCRYLSEDPDIDVVTTANNGQVALRQLEQHDIEAVVLDIEMPVMDGMTALPLIIKQKPGIQVVMASTLTLKNAEISLRAMQMGAVDYVPKPETARSVNASIDFRRELVEKVKAWAARSRKKRGETLPGASTSPGSSSGAGFVRPERKATAGFVSAKRPAAVSVTRPGSAAAGAVSNVKAASNDKAISLRPGSRRRPKVLAIGSSTGGPQALLKFFGAFSKKPDVPILITQHMPATFTSILANHLAQSTGWVAQEGKDGDSVRAGEIYIAPGGKHMEVQKQDGKHVIRLTDEPPENFCKPAVDPMFRSLVEIYGDTMLAVILTGMGHDGLKGARELTKAGGTVLAQDEASSVVWGMPGAVATAGLCTEVLPLDEIGAATMKRLQGGL